MCPVCRVYWFEFNTRTWYPRICFILSTVFRLFFPFADCIQYLPTNRLWHIKTVSCFLFCSMAFARQRVQRWHSETSGRQAIIIYGDCVYWRQPLIEKLRIDCIRKGFIWLRGSTRLSGIVTQIHCSQLIQRVRRVVHFYAQWRRAFFVPFDIRTNDAGERKRQDQCWIVFISETSIFFCFIFCSIKSKS